MALTIDLRGDAIDRWAEFGMLSVEPDDYFRWHDANREIDVTDLLSEIRCPVLLIPLASMEDTARDIGAASPDARLSRVPLGQMAELVRRFLREPKPRGALPLGRRLDTNADGLSAREFEVLAEVAIGRRNAEIADVLRISPATVKRHISNILRKTELSNRTELAHYAVER